ncbi:hypothetical protein PR048_010926 [Dryococelus australis]|uniref:Reverse transcriptase RNase H-like domain-containing protein n=1 Tax=Dryococelus australis TaxID=614101 RepID=A0ABQ9HK49_9NEOP|nr:hypothetical protein PR048_010926 [Dryococelus australis]
MPHSLYGIGVVLSHRVNGKEKPVAFTSSTLSKAEKALTTIFAVKHFHIYLYGQKFTLLTDHQPLRRLLGYDQGIPTLANSRLQHWAVVLLAYNYIIEYRKGSLMANADALLCLPILGSVDECVYSFSEALDIPMDGQVIAEAIKNDPILSKVLTMTKTGWSNVTDTNMKPFFCRCFELPCEEGFLTWGNRVVIPLGLQHLVLMVQHAEHPGIVRMKMCVLWFGGKTLRMSCKEKWKPVKLVRDC